MPGISYRLKVNLIICFITSIQQFCFDYLKQAKNSWSYFTVIYIIIFDVVSVL